MVKHLPCEYHRFEVHLIHHSPWKARTEPLLVHSHWMKNEGSLLFLEQQDQFRVIQPLQHHQSNQGLTHQL
jgi:hypothetical protein